MGRKILIADDEESIRTTFAEFIREAGYNVDESESLSSCLERVREKNYNLILLDVNFGKDDGIEALKKIKEASANSSVVMITGSIVPQSISRARKYGADDYIIKPIHKQSLLYIVKKYS